MAHRYYQVGGYGVMNWNTKPEDLARIMWPKDGSGLDLVFGVKPSGATYMYTPVSKLPDDVRQLRTPKTTSSTELLSLSPVHFSTLQELESCLSHYVSKNGKKGDNSKANKGLDATSGNEPTDLGKARALFEKQRLLLRGYIGDLTMPSHFALDPSPALKTTRFISLAFSLWQMDSRGIAEKKLNPIILDLGWSEFTITASVGSSGVQVVSSQHVIIRENSTLKNPQSTQFAYGESQKLSLTEAANQFQTFLYGAGQRPTVIFIHDFPQSYLKARDILDKVLGVHTETWHSDLEALDPLLQPNVMGSAYGFNPTSSRENGRTYSGSYYQATTIYPAYNPRSPVHAQAQPERASYHLVDLRTMIIKALRSVVLQDDTVLSNAQYLGVQGLPARGACAGNDARVLGLMWYSMASDGTFMQQQAQLAFSPQLAEGSTPQPEPQGPSGQPGAEDSDSDVDPNDIIPQQPMGPSDTDGPGKEKWKDPIAAAFDNSDEDDEEDSDSD